MTQNNNNIQIQINGITMIINQEEAKKIQTQLNEELNKQWVAYFPYPYLIPYNQPVSRQTF